MRNTAKPRFATAPTKGSQLAQKPILEAAAALGTPALPWQKRAIRLLGERRPATADEADQFYDMAKRQGANKHELEKLRRQIAGGIPRYRQVIATVPRQSGKTVLSKAAIKARAEERGGQEIYGTAQTRGHALIHMEDLAAKLPYVDYNRGAGREQMIWSNGSTYRIFAPNKKGGHGSSADFVLIDEAWSLTSTVLGGIVPAMSARPLAQMLIISTMGTVESTTWNGLVEAGRAAVDDPDSRLAYIEYSAEDPEDVFDPSKWGRWMPALGLTISPASIEADMALMEADPEQGRTEIVRAYANRTVAVRVTLFPADWVDQAWHVIDPPPRFVLAVAVDDDPAGATIATAHQTTDGKIAGRVVEWRAGPEAWVPAKVDEIVQRREVDAIVYDPGSPARALKAELEAISEGRMVPLVERSPRDFAADCARFYDGLRPDVATIALEKSEPLATSIAAAARKQIGDLWLVAPRLMSVDGSPIVAVILAAGTALDLAAQPALEWAIF